MSSRCWTLFVRTNPNNPPNKKSPCKLIFTPGRHIYAHQGYFPALHLFIHALCEALERSWTFPLRAQSIMDPGLIYCRSSFTGVFLLRPSARARAFAHPGGSNITHTRLSPTHTTKIGVWLWYHL